MHILYLIFIAPIELILNFIFTTSYDLVHSYGLSIIILSFVMSIILIPVYNIAESWQNAERLIQEKMKNELDFIKRCFKKQERMVMTNTTHKLHNYHPIMAVRTSVGFLIQVPFFFGAYHLLSNYTQLENIPFLIFKDLSQPDGLLSLGSLHINIMPIVMTIVSLVAGFIYTKNLAKKDKIQLLVLTLVFLVLLYNSPVGLVIYWTLNNIFSVLKNMIPKNIIKLPSFNITPKIPTYETKSHSTIVDKLLISLVFITLFFTILSLIGLGINSFVYTQPFRENASMSVLRPAIALLICTIIILYAFFIKDVLKKSISIWNHIKNNKVSACIVFLSLVLLISSSINLIKTTYIFSGHYSIFIRNSFFMIMITYILNAKYLYNFIDVKLQATFKNNYNTLFYGLFVAFILYIGLYLPISFIKNDTSYFEISPKKLLDTFLPILSFIVFIGICLNQFIAKKIFKNSSLFFALSILILLLFSFIDLHLGVLDGKAFADAEPLYRKINIIIDLAFSFIIMVLLVFVISSKLYKYINKLPMIFSLLIVIVSAYNYHDLQKVFKSNTHNNSKKTISYTNETLNFSKEHKNIIMLILDGFDGRYIQGMLDDKIPAINELSGFTYYSNTFSAANSTYEGYGAIIGGFKYTPEYIEKHHHDIMQGYQDIYKKLLTYYKSNNFETSLIHPAWLTPFTDQPWTSHCENNKLVDNCVSDFKTKANYSELLSHTYFKHEDSNKIQNDFTKHTLKFLPLKLAIFKITPLYFKKYLYNKSKWIDTTIQTGVSEKTKFIASMPYLSTTKAKTNTFKIVHSMISHYPFELNPNTCLFNTNKVILTTPYTKSLQGWEKDNYGDDVCTIKFVSNFIKWLKHNNIYDNTKIILVSEHDFTSSPLKKKLYHYNNNNDSVYSSKIYRPYSLLMVKDFNTNNKKLIIDTQHLMSSYDTPAILCEGLTNCHKEYGLNFTKENTENRKLVTSNTPWNPTKNHKDHYKILSQIQVTNNIFNVDNYKILPK